MAKPHAAIHCHASATGPVAAEDPGIVSLTARQVGQPPSRGRGGTLAEVTVLPLESLLPSPAGGGGHVQVEGPATGVIGLSGEGNHRLPLLQGQPLRPAVTRDPGQLPPVRPGLSVPVDRDHWATPLYAHLALRWQMEPAEVSLTSTAVMGPWVRWRSPSLQEPGEDGRCRVTRPGEVY